MEKEFIAEISNAQKLKIFFIIISSILLIAGIFISAINFFEGGQKAVFDFFSNEIKNPSLPGLFFLSFIVDLFFIPLPSEPLMIFSLQRGNPIILSLVLILFGLLAGNVVNYVVGEKFSNAVFIFMSRKKVYKVRRWANKYGAYAILLANLIPTLPSPLLSLGLGIAKYKFMRLFILFLIGALVKFILIIALYSLFQFNLFQ